MVSGCFVKVSCGVCLVFSSFSGDLGTYLVRI